MNKLKKIFVLVLIVAFVSLGVTACKQKDDQPSGDQSTQETAADEKAADEKAAGEHPK
jgi:hypothetical protein